jgi:two-component system, chemotaxis family, CheB/CheR fusion protein
MTRKKRSITASSPRKSRARKASMRPGLEMPGAPAQLRELSVALAMAEERERRAIAVDLHDDIGQLLALLKIRLDLLRGKAPAGPLADELQSASTLLLQASDRLRSLTFQLSPPILHEIGLVPALEWLADEMKRLYNLNVTIDADSNSRRTLDPRIRTILFRAVRELLINVGKHANAKVARVECRISNGQMVVSVKDGGKGFDPKLALSGSNSRGFGLFSVRERIAGLGGSMTCESSPGDGSRVTLRVPVPAPVKTKS